MNEQKFIPALVFKNTCDKEFEIYNFEAREVFVRDLYLPPSKDMMQQIIDQQMLNDDGNFSVSKKYISSIKIIPKFKIEHQSCKIKITDQPIKRILYETSCNIYRNYKTKVQVGIEVIKTYSSSTEIKWKTSVTFDI